MCLVVIEAVFYVRARTFAAAKVDLEKDVDRFSDAEEKDRKDDRGHDGDDGARFDRGKKRGDRAGPGEKDVFEVVHKCKLTELA